jgi:hypothetical protein
MKKIFALLLTTLLASGAYAQMNKSTWLLSGATSFDLNTYSSNIVTLNGNLKAGFLILKNVAIGINYNKSAYYYGGQGSSVIFEGLFSRYYLPKNFFAGVGISAVTHNSKGVTTQSWTSSAAFPLEVGLAAFVTRNIAIEPCIMYIKGDHTGNATNNAQVAGYSKMLGIHLGIALYFNRK